MDKEYKIKNISELIYDDEDKKFYMLANKRNEKIGLYLVSFREDDPLDYHFFLKYQNKLDIGNAHVSIMRNKKMGYKELLVAYKSIFMNTYTV